MLCFWNVPCYILSNKLDIYNSTVKVWYSGEEIFMIWSENRQKYTFLSNSLKIFSQTYRKTFNSDFNMLNPFGMMPNIKWFENLNVNQCQEVNNFILYDIVQLMHNMQRIFKIELAWYICYTILSQYRGHDQPITIYQP